MTKSERINTFADLGAYLRAETSQSDLTDIAHRAHSKNNWFTPETVLKSLNAIANEFLDFDKLTAWASQYNFPDLLPDAHTRTVGVVMAGNIPAVGFHDLLCVLISGHRALLKLSSQDFVLIQYLIQKIAERSPKLGMRIEIAERLNAADAYIATGSDNTARYFSYYFAQKPHIIRRNRTSVAVLMGEENPAEFAKLGNDLLDYYGLGCRNVSTLFVPENLDGSPYDFVPLLQTLDPRLDEFRNHHKYLNNYDYNKSIYLINGTPHLDNGFLLLTPTPGESLVSPISVVFYRHYRDQADLAQQLAAQASKIQVVASAQGWYPGAVAFGKTQSPTLTDYADGVDTMAFLAAL
jgi:hypothetical protein